MKSQKILPQCVDCKYYSANSRGIFSFCTHKDSQYDSCEGNRERGICGEEGKLFEKKKELPVPE
jgi:hypothetical protein